MKRLLVLAAITLPLLATPPSNQIVVTDTSGSTQTNRPYTTFRSFAAGDFPAGTYPRPRVSGTPLSSWQINVMTHWRDATAACGAPSFNNATPITGTCSGNHGYLEGDTITVAGTNKSALNQTWVIYNVTYTTFQLVGSVAQGTVTGGSVTGPAFGSIQDALITFPVTVSANSSTIVDFVQDSNPCHLGNQTTCDATGMQTNSDVLNFNSGNWGAAISTTVNGLSAQQISARTMVTNGFWRAWVKGPLLNQIIVEDRGSASACPASSPGNALGLSGTCYDWGYKDLRTTVIADATVAAAAISFHVSDSTTICAKTLPTTILVSRINTISTETITVNSCSAGNTLNVTRGGSPIAFNAGSLVIVTSVASGGSNSWKEHAIGRVAPSGGPATCDTTHSNVTPTQTSIIFKGELWNAFTGSYPYALLIDSETLTATGHASINGNQVTMTVSRSAGAAHIGCSTVYAAPFVSNWVAAPTNAYRSLHPIFMLSMWTGVAVVKEEFIVENMWTGRLQDQHYTLALKSGAALGTTQVAADTVDHRARTRWRRTFWDGTAPGATNEDHGLAYMAYSKVLPPFDPNLVISAATVTRELNLYNNSNDNPYDGFGHWDPTMPDTGGRGENSIVTRWDAVYLYAMAGAGGNASPTQITQLYALMNYMNEYESHVPFNQREDDASRFYDDQHTVNAFGHSISRDARPLASAGVNSAQFYFAGVQDNPVPMGYAQNWNVFQLARIADGVTIDQAHQNTVPYVGYLLTGDWYFLESIQNNASINTFMSYPGTGAKAVNQSTGDSQCYTCGHNEWAFNNDASGLTRGIAFVQKPILEAFAHSPDTSPEKRYFNQKFAYNVAVREGIMNSTTGSFYDTAATSKWWWGRNVVANHGNITIPNPLRIFLANEGSDASQGGYVNYDATHPAGFVCSVSTPCTCSLEAVWQQGFLIDTYGRAEDLGMMYGKPVRKDFATWVIGWMNYANPVGYLGTAYLGTRSAPSGGATNCGGFNPSTVGMTPYSTYAQQVAVMSASEQTNSVIRWNNGVNSDEAYPQIYAAASAYYTDVDYSPCTRGNPAPGQTCGHATQAWLRANLNHQENFATWPQWDWVARSAAGATCAITSPVALPSWELNLAGYSQAMTKNAACGTGTWSVSSGALPTGLSISGGGTISGTPTAAGLFSFTLLYADGVTNPTQPNSITINAACAITSTSPFTSGVQGSVYAGFTVQSTNCVPSTGWSISAGALPTGLLLGSGTGSITGTPSVAGTHNFTVLVADGLGATFSLPAQMVIADPPPAGGGATVSITVGRAVIH